MDKIENYVTNDLIKFQLKKRIELLNSIAKNKKSSLQKAPPGNIRIVKSGKRTQYYLITKKGDTNGVYLPVKKKSLVIKIFQRQYDKKVCIELEKQLKILKRCYKAYKPEKIEQIYTMQKKGRREYIESVVLNQSKFVENWKNTYYEHKQNNSASLKISTSFGELMRSKSEVLIAEALYKKNVPFKYEYPISVKNYTVHPDFYCLNVRTGKIIIWEHFGLLENSEYAAQTVQKLYDYQRAGFFPGKNLIISTESKEFPLNSQTIEEIIDAYF